MKAKNTRVGGREKSLFRLISCAACLLLAIAARADGAQVLVQGYVAQKSVLPRYPQNALKNQQEGRVTIQFSVDQFGRAKALHIIRASPTGVFERTAMAAIKASQFKPIAMRVTQTIIFSLTGEINPPPKPSTIGKSILTASHNGHY